MFYLLTLSTPSSPPTPPPRRPRPRPPPPAAKTIKSWSNHIEYNRGEEV